MCIKNSMIEIQTYEVTEDFRYWRFWKNNEDLSEFSNAESVKQYSLKNYFGLVSKVMSEVFPETQVGFCFFSL